MDELEQDWQDYINYDDALDLAEETMDTKTTDIIWNVLAENTTYTLSFNEKNQAKESWVLDIPPSELTLKLATALEEGIPPHERKRPKSKPSSGDAAIGLLVSSGNSDRDQ